MRSRARRWSLAAQLLVWQLVALLLVLLVVAAITVQQSTSDFRSSRQTRMLAVAESLAATPVVRSELVEGGNRRALEAQLGRAASLSGARRVQLACVAQEQIAARRGAGGSHVRWQGLFYLFPRPDYIDKRAAQLARCTATFTPHLPHATRRRDLALSFSLFARRY